MVNIYVGNLPFDLTEAELEGLFAPHGQVQRVNLIMDRETGRPRGFAFVEMADEAAASAAISALDGTSVGSRKITVNVAKPREARGGGGG
ncbi:MAG: RNA-binding protein, partial [Planctomycetes bacterium]|nr:RNA-binding protein [Planctomycetota bacterium]